MKSLLLNLNQWTLTCSCGIKAGVRVVKGRMIQSQRVLIINFRAMNGVVCDVSRSLLERVFYEQPFFQQLALVVNRVSFGLVTRFFRFGVNLIEPLIVIFVRITVGGA